MLAKPAPSDRLRIAHIGLGGMGNQHMEWFAALPDVEIVDRLLLPLVNEGARILEEGIAQRASDIDVVYLTGYGFPVHRGGPMYHAGRVGLGQVLRRMKEFAANAHADPRFWNPPKLIVQLAAQGKTFEDPPAKSRPGKRSKARG